MSLPSAVEREALRYIASSVPMSVEWFDAEFIGCVGPSLRKSLEAQGWVTVDSGFLVLTAAGEAIVGAAASTNLPSGRTED